MRVAVTVEAEPAIELLERLSTAVGSDTVLRFLGEKMHDYESDLFASGGEGRWAALDPSTIAAKGNARVLVDQGDLLHQLTAGPLRLAGDTVTIDTDDVAATMAQRGARGMPLRDPAPVPPAGTVEGWASDLLDALLSGL